jgi:fucose 4-O-acetylase-like acetyltransferase
MNERLYSTEYAQLPWIHLVWKMFLMDSSFFTFVAARFIMGIDVRLQTANLSNGNLRLAGPYWNLSERIFE